MMGKYKDRTICRWCFWGIVLIAEVICFQMVAAAEKSLLPAHEKKIITPRKFVDAYERSTSKDEMPDDGFALIANDYFMLSQYDKALELYRSVFAHKHDPVIAGKIVRCLAVQGRKEEAMREIKALSANDEKYSTGLKLQLADALKENQAYRDSKDIYNRILSEDPGNVEALMGLARTYIAEKNYEEAQKIVDEMLKQSPDNIDALFARGEILEARGRFLDAYRYYDQISLTTGKSQAARNLKYRSLSNMGASYLAGEKLKSSGDVIDPAVRAAIAGDQAVERIEWGESELALILLEQNAHDASEAIAKEGLLSYGPFVLSRSYGDRIVALSQRKKMEQLIKEYERMEKAGDDGLLPVAKESPLWVLSSTADAYLYLKQPKKSLKLYQYVLSKTKKGEDFNVRMAIYSNLVELGRYKEAAKVLAELDRDTPVQIVERGVLQDNARKEEIAFNGGWLLLYQDRLKEAQKYNEELLNRAPFDTNIRTSLAYTYLWRSWPRKALEEFQIVQSIDPTDLAGTIGRAYALNENNKGKEARRLAKELLARFPTDQHVQQLNRYFKVQDMPSVSGGFAYERENTSAREIFWHTKYEQPLVPGKKVFVDYVWRNDTEKRNSLIERTRRTYVGTDLRLTRDLSFVGAVSDDFGNKNFGFNTAANYELGDHFSFGGMYDSYSLDLPFRARAFNVTGKEWSANARYRQSELFSLSGKTSEILMSDGNAHTEYHVVADQAVYTSAYVKGRIAAEWELDQNKKTDVPYFSPKLMNSVIVTPMIEHVIYKRYDKAILQRVFWGQGMAWQTGFGGKYVWDVRYEQEYHLSDTVSFLAGTSYASRVYDGDNAAAWTFDASFKWSLG